MRVLIPQSTQFDSTAIGGGWTFLRNFYKGFEIIGGVQFVQKPEDTDVCFIANITQIDKTVVMRCDELGVPIVMRVDNIPRKSRNRRSNPAERLKEFGDLATIVIYQSDWSKEYAGYLAGDGTVIYNGCDTSVFKPDGEKHDRVKRHVSLIVRHSSDEVKRLTEALYHHHMDWRGDTDRELWLVGRFSTEEIESRFDLFAGEVFQLFGEESDREELAKIMRSADELIYPAAMDACPNVVIEALASGLKVSHVSDLGGTKELVNQDGRSGSEYLSLERMCQEYLGVFKLAAPNA